MITEIISSIKGCCTIRAEGRFPERVLNIASVGGVYVYNVKRNGDSLVFSASKKGAQKLLSEKIEGLTLTLIDEGGVPVFLAHHKKRIALFTLPLIFFAAIYVFSGFIWQVNITGGTPELQEQVLQVISEYGVHKGALKHKIDCYDIKHRAILAIDDLAWLWVDIKGTSANVNIRQRKATPSMIKINEPADVVTMHDGIVEQIRVYCGIPLIKEGDVVEKGQLAVTGVLRSENEAIPTYFHHAAADIILRTNEKTTYFIPSKILKKSPTGKKKNVFGIKFKKNIINFSLNSGISYANYDKIEKITKIPLIPISFIKTTYREMDVVEEENNTDSELKRYRMKFIKKLEGQNMDIVKLDEHIINVPSGIKVTYVADCLVRTDKEIPIAAESRD